MKKPAKRVGRPYKFTPAQFEKAWKDYFDHCDNNPWYKNEAIKSGEFAGQLVKIPTARPYSEIGFCAFHDLGEKYLCQLSETLEGKESKEEKELSYILTRARAKCYNQKFEGASVGAFNANIIARVLGLSDKKDITTNGESLNKKMTQEEAKEYLKQLNNDV